MLGGIGRSVSSSACVPPKPDSIPTCLEYKSDYIYKLWTFPLSFEAFLAWMCAASKCTYILHMPELENYDYNSYVSSFSSLEIFFLVLYAVF